MDKPDKKSGMTIWIDADACPRAIKEIVFRASERLRIMVHLVANRNLAVPQSPLVSMVRVAEDFNGADRYILEQVGESDLVVTADIPLAAEIVKKGAIAIDPRGDLYTSENVGERLSVRNFMQDLRAVGLVQGGCAELGAADRRKFAAALDSTLAQVLRRRS